MYTLSRETSPSRYPPRATRLPTKRLPVHLLSRVPYRRHPHHFYLHAESLAQGPLPPLLLLLRETRRIELAAGGSKEMRKGNLVVLLLAERAR